MHKIVGLLFFIISPGIFACEYDVSEKIKEKYSLWKQKDMQQYYYLVQKQCFCAPEYTRLLKVFVTDNHVVRVVDVKTGKEVTQPVMLHQRTISQWYDAILESLKHQRAEVNVEYNQEGGYPSLIYIDPHTMRADDEYTVFIDQLTEN